MAKLLKRGANYSYEMFRSCIDFPLFYQFFNFCINIFADCFSKFLKVFDFVSNFLRLLFKMISSGLPRVQNFLTGRSWVKKVVWGAPFPRRSAWLAFFLCENEKMRECMKWTVGWASETTESKKNYYSCTFPSETRQTWEKWEKFCE